MPLATHPQKVLTPRQTAQRETTNVGHSGMRGARMITMKDRGLPVVCGLVLHAGPHSFALDERILAAPIASLWS